VLVDAEWLEQRRAADAMVVLDMRWREDGSARRRYEAGHLPGALHLDWSTDIVDPDSRTAFMLAPPDRFARAMERLGIADDTTVVAYADVGGSGPFRLWWGTRMYGHDQVRVLDGGLHSWLARGGELEAGSVEPAPAAPGSWTARAPLAHLVASAENVLAGAGQQGPAILDSRPPEQFRGEFVWFETGPVPADDQGIAHTARGELRAGRVPWAASVPSARLYRPDRTLKPAEELRAMFADAGAVDLDRPVVAYCGVGISATALAFALTVAGYRDVAVYDGSWDEWGRDPSKPVARG
jgi:thiosulfate/3-mercaptopyruvate sulfurtransferase